MSTLDPSPRPPATADGAARQPWLHEFDIAVDGPATVVCDRAGDVGRSGTGVFVDDRRVVSELLLTFDGIAPTPIAGSTVGNESVHWLAVRHLGDDAPDATVDVHRQRRVDGRTVVETITVTSRGDESLATEIGVSIAGDGAEIATVKAGRSGRRLPAEPSPLGWADERHRTRLGAAPTADRVDVSDGAQLSWRVGLEPATPVTITLTISVAPVAKTGFDATAGSAAADWDPELLAASIDDPRLAAAVRVGLTDLRHLLLRDPENSDDLVAAAGTPWYLTLFGRDALWTARFMLPYSHRLAIGTLRALARRQATIVDDDISAEQGKILHELRRTTDAAADFGLPPVYYGTVDATPLWITLLAEVVETVEAPDLVTELRTHLDAALDWMATSAERGDGLLRYANGSGRGLANQGWKDSGDAMRRADGTIVSGSIALVEAQAYAVEAALAAAGLLDRTEPGAGDRWRAWAADLRTRVAAQFWVDGDPPYLAMAIDGDGNPIDGVGSNMGHTVGTGLLTADEERIVVERLLQPDLLRRFGIGTLSSANPGYNPVGYHTGSVWAHDTAIAAAGMAAGGHDEAARVVAERLLDLAAATEYRLPELCAGETVGDSPVPYPAACRPQAWAAASSAALLSILRVG